MTKDTKFHKELKELLKKFDAELVVEEGGVDSKMVVDFNWKPDTEEESTPQLVLGTWENGDT